MVRDDKIKYLWLALLAAVACGMIILTLIQLSYGQEIGPAGEWTKVPEGQLTMATNAPNVLILSTWSPIVDEADQVLIWREQVKKKGPKDSIAWKLLSNLMTIKGVTNVTVSRHRIQIVKADVFTWDMIVPEVLAILENSELEKN